MCLLPPKPIYMYVDKAISSLPMLGYSYGTLWKKKTLPVVLSSRRFLRTGTVHLYDEGLYVVLEV